MNLVYMFILNKVTIAVLVNLNKFPLTDASLLFCFILNSINNTLNK